MKAKPLLPLTPANRSFPTGRRCRLTIAPATARDRETIYRLRHEVYARELGQHRTNSEGALRDALDEGNVYIVAHWKNALAGFISITPPTRPALSIDKYFARETLPFSVDHKLHEVRLLTVRQPARGTELAAVLMYAALRWVEAHGGEGIVAMGRREILQLYRKAGLEPVGRSARSGAVTYELLRATIDHLRAHLGSHSRLLSRLEARVDWQLQFPFRKPAACFHGGAFFSAIGPKFDALEQRAEIINADVLDAWFPPAPRVLSTLQAHLPWLLRTSPPTACEGLVETIAETRGVHPENLLLGAGSSDLIFRALRHWLNPLSRVLLLDPTYGEYAHVLEGVIGCQVDRFPLVRANQYNVPLATWEAALARDYDLCLLVNPNSPTGRVVTRAALAPLLRRVSPRTRVWVDETYIDYVSADESIERLAAQSENIVVCKSLSKVYALSGARAAYLCGAAHQFEELRAITPPWVIGLPTQVAAVNALQDPEYYATRYAENRSLREQLQRELGAIGWQVVPGVANFLLVHLPKSGPAAATIADRCRAHGLFLRDARTMGALLGQHALRIAVKDEATQQRMLTILRRVCS